MIPKMNIVAWSRIVPWPEDRQVEQDLVICRALVAIFNDDFLKKELRFRGGTALNKVIEESTDELSFLVKTLGME